MILAEKRVPLDQVYERSGNRAADQVLSALEVELRTGHGVFVVRGAVKKCRKCVEAEHVGYLHRGSAAIELRLGLGAVVSGSGFMKFPDTAVLGLHARQPV